MRKYIAGLKSGSSVGTDNISAEHFKYAVDSVLVTHLCQLFTWCFKYGIVPTEFKKGLLIPLLKKPTLDPSEPKNYRPVIISNDLSKIVEMFIVDECSGFEFSPFQFGFIKGRGTSSAIALAHDVSSYCVPRGLPFLCAGWMLKAPLTAYHIQSCLRRPWGYYQKKAGSYYMNGTAA